MKNMSKQKLEERNIPSMNRHNQFKEIEYAENVGKTLKRILVYFGHEKTMVLCMLIIVMGGTICGIYAPSLQSNAIDIIAKNREGSLAYTLTFIDRKSVG